MLEFFSSYLLLYKYLILFVVAILGSIGVPLPLTALIVTSGIFSSQGFLDFNSVIIYTLIGNIIGDLIIYYISFYYGKKILSKIGFKKIINSKHFKLVEKKFKKYSSVIIVFSRLLAMGLGPIVNILSGLGKVKITKFLLLNIIGETLYVLIFTSIGYLFENSGIDISGLLKNIAIIIISIVTIIIIIKYKFFKKYYIESKSKLK